MNISHEVPLELLRDSLKYNDYQYVLPHLIDKSSLYRDFILWYRKQENSFIICDNGLFEGVKHTEEDLINKINLIKPDIFVVPDEWNNLNKTWSNAYNWISNIEPSLPINTKLMVVMQGNHIGEFIQLYENCKDIGYTHFAFNHSSIAYHNMFSHHNTLINQMWGRIFSIAELRNEEIIKETDYIHLLGCSLPQEFQYYKGYNFIKSIDTSNPIIMGYEGMLYDRFIDFKITKKIEEIFYEEISLRQKEDIIFNIEKFREYVNN